MLHLLFDSCKIHNVHVLYMLLQAVIAVVSADKTVTVQ